jgi:hypothetical protein
MTLNGAVAQFFSVYTDISSASGSADIPTGTVANHAVTIVAPLVEDLASTLIRFVPRKRTSLVDFFERPNDALPWRYP